MPEPGSKGKVVAQPGGRKPYRAPSLTEYGSVAKLTRTTLSGIKNDGGAHPVNKRV